MTETPTLSKGVMLEASKTILVFLMPLIVSGMGWVVNREIERIDALYLEKGSFVKEHELYREMESVHQLEVERANYAPREELFPIIIEIRKSMQLMVDGVSRRVDIIAMNINRNECFPRSVPSVLEEEVSVSYDGNER